MGVGSGWEHPVRSDRYKAYHESAINQTIPEKYTRELKTRVRRRRFPLLYSYSCLWLLDNSFFSDWTGSLRNLLLNFPQAFMKKRGRCLHTWTPRGTVNVPCSVTQHLQAIAGFFFVLCIGNSDYFFSCFFGFILTTFSVFQLPVSHFI